MMGATKTGEYYRSIELFEEIVKTQRAYFGLAFLYDSQYDREDIRKMMELCKPKNYKRESRNSDKLPTSMDYADFLRKICAKEKIDIETARNKYGQFTYREWNKLLN